jgi:O-antigen/teichoic acid export membrane protein
VAIAVARALAPSERGEFVLLTLVPQLAAYVATVGFPAAALYGVARDPEELPAYWGGAVVTSLAASAVTGVATGVLAMVGLVPPLGAALALPAGAGVAFLFSAAWILFGRGKFALAGALRAAPLALSAGAIVAAWSTTGVSAVSAYATWVIAHVGIACYVLTKARHRTVLPSRLQWRRWFGYGVRSTLNQVSQLIALRVDQLILAALTSTAAVGTYSIAASLSEALLLGATAIGVVVFAESAAGRSQQLFRKELLAAVVVAVLLSVALVATAHVLVTSIFGDGYAAAAAPLKILALGTPGLVAMRLVTNHLAGLGRPGRASIYAATSAVVVLALDLVLIPQAGAAGAAWASAIGYSVGGVIVALEVLPASVRRRRSYASA